MGQLRILLTTAGAGNANNLIRSLRRSELDCFIVGTNISKYELARSLADKNYLVPRFSHDDYIAVIQEIIDCEMYSYVCDFKELNEEELKALKEIKKEIINNE